MGSNISAPEGWNTNVTNINTGNSVSYFPTTHNVTPQRLQKNLKPVKILLLGAGGSGKSTFLKQLRVLKDEPFTSDDIEIFRQLIFSNLTGGIRNLGNVISEKNIAVSKEVRQHLKAIEDFHDLRDGESFPNSLRERFKALREDPSVQQAWKDTENTALSENLPYFFSSIDRLFRSSYVPSEQDVMQHNVRTTGISETQLNVHGYPVIVVDVGGQRSERRKWIHCFPNATCVIFSVNLNGYDQCLFEDNSKNEMEDALAVWDTITSSPWFTNSLIILLLNKYDLFEQKVLTSNIQTHFPDFGGPADDVDAGYRYFERRFARSARKGGRVGEKAVHIFPVSTTDTSTLRNLIPTIEDVILKFYRSPDVVLRSSPSDSRPL